MGRIVRRFARFHEMDFVGKVVGGTYTVPMTQTEAAQNGIECVVGANALGGTVNGALLGVIGAASLTGTLAAVRPRINVLTGVTVTGSVYGIQSSVYMRGTAHDTDNFMGARLVMQDDVGVVHDGNVFALMLDNVMNSAGTYSMIRCDENGTKVVNVVLSVYIGPDVNFAFAFGGAKTAWNNAGDVIGGGAPNANASGFIRVNVGGAVRNIQLFL